jgi:hypothetical protein
MDNIPPHYFTWRTKCKPICSVAYAYVLTNQRVARCCSVINTEKANIWYLVLLLRWLWNIVFGFKNEKEGKKLYSTCLFWRRCVIHGITRAFGEGMETPTLLDPLERAYLNHWISHLKTEHRSSLWIPEDGQSPQTWWFWTITLSITDEHIFQTGS